MGALVVQIESLPQNLEELHVMLLGRDPLEVEGQALSLDGLQLEDQEVEDSGPAVADWGTAS